MPVEELSVFLYKLTRILFVGLLSLLIYYLINIGNKFVSEEERININKNHIWPAVITIIILVIIYNLFNTYSILSDTLFTIIFSIILAYLFNPIISMFEEKGIPRFWAVILLYVIILAIFFIFAFLILPRTGREIKKFISNMPVYIEEISGIVDKIITKYDATIGELPPVFDTLDIKGTISKNIAGFQKIVLNGLKSFVSTIGNIFAKAVSWILTPILTLYFIVDKEYFMEKALGLIPKKHLDESLGLFEEINDSLSKFVRGRLLMAVYVGVSVTIVLLILRVDFAVAIGFITGFADIIPYIGPFIGFLPAVFFAILDSPGKAVWVAALFLLIQWTENNVLAPKVIGDTTGLHPMVILLSIIVGGGMFGVFGMILSVPIVAVAIILYKFIRNKIKERSMAE